MRRCLVVVLPLMLVSSDAMAQVTDAPQRVSNATMLVVNAALGGFTAGLWRAAAGKPSWTAFGRGAAAGTVVFAGKRIIGEATSPAWWFGRQLAAVGSSEVANAAQGKPFLQTAVLPLGPLRIHIDRSARRKVSPRLDLASSIATIAVASQDGSRFAIRESVSTGAIVFLVPETSNEVGRSSAGVVTISELAPDGKFPPLEGKRSVLSHEIVHASQYDFGFSAWGDAMQSALAKRNSWGRRISSFVDINLALPIQLGANGIIDYEDRPWEREAVSLAANGR
ncbi:MAG TPA: hypothetical protein VGC52_00025 [Gemmatimonadaceae bacterium]